MKENVIDVLMYILENAVTEEDTEQYDQESLKSMLIDAGFAQLEIHEAFRWLDELDTQISEQPAIQHGQLATRHFSEKEKAILDTECQNYLLGLINVGILSHNSFELVIDRLIALQISNIDLDHLEWIVLIVLSNQADELVAFQRLETLRFHEPNTYLN